MKLINLLQSILSVISSAMLYPVMILLIVLFVWMIITTGEFFSEYRKRKKHTLKREMKELIESLIESLSQKKPEISPFLKREMPAYFREFLGEFIDELKGDKDARGIRIEYLLQSKEQKMARSLDKLRLMVRIGPTLGLMGTIIPMGPALSALSKGDLEMLSSNIIIAFTTTVDWDYCLFSFDDEKQVDS